jgi:hypothetical protein
MVVLVKQGFMSYGVLAISTIMLFVAQFFRPRWLLAIGTLACVYPGLSVYVTYMRDRDQIRSVVWSEDSTLSEKLQAAWHTASNIDLFDPKDPDQLMYIDGRLNQDGLVGAAVENLSGTGEFRNGSTIVEAIVAMIPRLIWPDKPIGAGSGRSCTGVLRELRDHRGRVWVVLLWCGRRRVGYLYGNSSAAGQLADVYVLLSGWHQLPERQRLPC